ncbi:hypothetical protein AHF37_02914 [Paragonimus kellicotti]|nr:hypothetical protein AHF37_02914 [Paragonimus kellicotti]
MKHKLCSSVSPLSFKLQRLENGSSCAHHNANSVNSLFDLSAKVVAEYLPFEYVERTLVHIPEPVQEKIIFYSFPRRDSDIYTYASFHPKGDKCRDKIPYYEGLDYFQNDCVEDVIQIGFHLTGSVKHQHLCVSSEMERRKYEVSITFDRCKIISVCCDCGNKGLSWCPHVVALALFRIRNPHLVDYRSPISDALVRMDRGQLQKFAQYLIASHPNKVLPSAQLLADQLLQPESNINKTSGAPDPTAGASLEDVAAWYLDEMGVRDQLRTELANLASAGSVSGITGYVNSGANNTNNSVRTTSGLSAAALTVISGMGHSGTSVNHLRGSSSSIDVNRMVEAGSTQLSNAEGANLEATSHISDSGKIVFPTFSMPRSTLKSRRTHRGIEMPARVHSLSRSASVQQMPTFQLPTEQSPSATNPASIGSGPNSNQLPGWTARLWEEVCVLWTCVVLNPDCSADTRRNWRHRFIHWTRAHRCPRDEAYAVPAHYFASLRDPNELEDEGAVQASTGHNHQSQQQQSQNRSVRRAAVFQLPLEVSFMSWDDDCLRQLIGLDNHKRIKSDLVDLYDDQNDLTPASTMHMVDVDDNSSDLFRRPTFGTPRRPIASNRPQSASSIHSSSSSSLSSSPARDCHCPYCDLTSPLNEPFPLLCLRVAALRANGYFTQALRLAVFVSQRLLRAFKTKVSHVNSMAHHNGARNVTQPQPPQNVNFGYSPYPPAYYPHQPYAPVSGSQLNDTPVRRTLFTPNGSGVRPGGPILHGGATYGPSRYTNLEHIAPLSGTSSTACPSHTESGWVGLPGRPLISLVECLLDAAAIVVESSGQDRHLRSHYQSIIDAQPWSQMESASFYLCLSVKVSLFAVFQQRRLSGSVNRLLACQTQEARLLALLNTMPRDPTSVLAICETLSQLLGPPTSLLTRHAVRSDQGSPGCAAAPAWPPHSPWFSPASWCWSALGPVIHPDSYPVHTVAQFVLDYVLEAQKQNPLSLVNNCWAGIGPHGSIPSIRVDDLLFAVVNRAMRFSVLETVSDTLTFPNLSMSRPSTGHTDNHLYHFRDRTPYSHRSEFDRALAVHTEVADLHPTEPYIHPNFNTGCAEPIPQTSYLLSGSYYHPIPPRSSGPAPSETDRWFVSLSHHPPMPSTLVSAVNSCFKLLDTSGGNGSYPPVPPITPLGTPPLTTSAQRHSADEFAPINTTAPSNNACLRRCLEAFELQQTQLAISMIRISRSHLHRLDQTVQVCDRHIHSATSLLTISQQVFAEAVALEPTLSGMQGYDPVNLFKSTLLSGFANSLCHQLGSSTASSAGLLAANPNPLRDGTNCPGTVLGALARDRINLLCTTFHLALLVVLRTLTRTVHWRRREMLAWAVSTALHVGPSACLYLVTHWATFVTPREAVNWLAPALLSVIGKSEVGTSQATSTVNESKHGVGGKTDEPGPMAPCTAHSVSSPEPPVCSEHALLFGLGNPEGSFDPADFTSPASEHATWAPWHGFLRHTSPFAVRNPTNSVAMAAQLFRSAAPYSVSAREHICSAVRTMAMQAAAKDPINCALPALTLAERNAAAFDAVYRLVLNSAETGALGPAQLFSLARYMDGRGWAWRAFPFALHATRLFVLSTMQDSHPVAGHVLWACSLAHRLGPGALQELLGHVIRNIHCPTLLTEILHRCRMSPSGILTNHSNPILLSSNGPPIMDLVDPNTGTRNPCPPSFGSSSSIYYGNCVSTSAGGKLLSLDRPPLKGCPNPSTEVGLHWLLRYRRLILHQNLFSSTSSGPDSCPLRRPEPGSMGPTNFTVSPESCTANWLAGQRNSFVLSLESGQFTCGPSPHGAGSQIAAMFAKVRELLTKRDSNGPRLLSLITEELLRYPKIPLRDSDDDRSRAARLNCTSVCLDGRRTIQVPL